MKLHIDYHFHPNFPRNDEKAFKKAVTWWRKLKEADVNTVICTEHVFKNPKRAYKLMLKAKPEDCFVFPGMEYLTKEGVDIIIFSDNENIYDFSELAPYKLSYEEVVNFIFGKNLQAIIVHPHILSSTSIIRTLGEKEFRKYLEKLRSVEISNTSGPKNKKVYELPKEDYPNNPKLLSVGSDAHHYEDLGTYIEVECDKNDVFDKVCNNSSPKIHKKSPGEFDLIFLIKSSITTLGEGLRKRIFFKYFRH